MNKDIFQGKWKELKGKVKQQWGDLTDDEVTQIEGNYDELSGLLQKKYGYAKDEAQKSIDKFLEKSGYSEKTY